MGLEIYPLYDLLRYYKNTVVEILNKIDTNLAEAVDNCNSARSTKSTQKKYEISSHMTNMLPHYVQILQTVETMAAQLLRILNEVGCDVQPEKNKALTNPFLIPDLPHFEMNSLQNIEPELKESVHLEMDFSSIKGFLPIETEGDELKQEIIAKENNMFSESVENLSEIQNKDSEIKSDVLEPKVVISDIDIKNESIENTFITQNIDSNSKSTLKPEMVEVNTDIKDERVENHFIMESTGLNSESTCKAEMFTSEIHIKDENNDSVYSEDNESRNLEDQQTAQTASQPKNDLKTGNNEILVQQPQGRCEQKSKKSKKRKKSQAQSSSQHEIVKDDNLEIVQRNSKTVPENCRYNWREEAVKRLMNENLKTTLSWSVSPAKNQNKRENEKRSKGSSPIFEIPGEELSVGQSCTFIHIESPSNFYVLTDQSLLGSLENSLNEDMNKHQFVVNKYKSKKLAKNNLGKYCAAFLSDIRRWHRVKILDWMDEEPETVFVQLIDYGETSYLSYKYIKNMPELYATVPKIAIRCHVAGIYSSHTQFANKWSTASVDFFVDLSEIRKRTKFVVVFAVKEGNSYGVNLNKENYPEGESLSELLVKSGHAREEETSNHLEIIAEEEDFEKSEEVFTEKILHCQTFPKVTLPPVGATVEILITGYVSTCRFYAHILYKQRSGFYNDDFDHLHQLLNLNNMVETYESFNISPKIGDLVLVKEKQEWFRGVCTESNGDNNFEIFLVDFGYSVVKNVTNLRQIKEEFLTVPSQAVECVLDNCQEKKRVSADVSKNVFQNLMYMQCFCGVVLECGEPLRIQLWDSSDMEMSHVLKTWGIGEEPS